MVVCFGCQMGTVEQAQVYSSSGSSGLACLLGVGTSASSSDFIAMTEGLNAGSSGGCDSQKGLLL